MIRGLSGVVVLAGLGTASTRFDPGLAATRVEQRPVAPSPPAPPESVNTPEARVKMTNRLVFSPARVRIPAGGQVLWTNLSRVSHTVTCDPKVSAKVKLPDHAGSFDSGDIQPAREFIHTFDLPGTYVYVCRYHGEIGMVGRVDVEPRR